MTTAATILKVNNLCVDFGESRVVDNISFELHAKQTLALVGESGSGKSSVALSVTGLLPYPHAKHAKNSSIVFDESELIGKNNKFMQSIRGARIGMIFQEPLSALNPLHSIGKQIKEAVRTHENLSKVGLNNKVLELLDMVELPFMSSRLDALPHELSGGQRQRVMIAMALAAKPDLLIADEPTTALDVTVQAQILDLLKGLQEKLGMSMLLITHDLSVVEKMADYVCIMRGGKMVESGKTLDVIKNPKAEYTKLLIDARNCGHPICEPNQKMLLKALDLVVKFPKRKNLFGNPVDWTIAVNGADICVNKGQTLGIVGESGSGKTTLGFALLRLVKSSGNISFLGKELKLKPNKDFRKNAQIVFQDPFGSLSPRMSAGEIIAEGLKVHGSLNKKQRDEKVALALKAVRMDFSCAHKYPHEFSGGQRQRIAIARSIVLEPSLIILDEPTSALDLPVQKEVLSVLRELQERLGIAYIFISHDIGVVRSISHRIAVMKDGLVIEQGSANEVFENPQNDYTKTLLAAA